MSHAKPHLDREGLCQCDCRKCTVTAPTGAQICVCHGCDAKNCGMHTYAPELPFDDD